MPRIPERDERRDAIRRLAMEANLSDVAEWLDLRVIGRGTHSPKVICPFHDDQRPSLHLYSASGRGPSQFHCFACGAHGDVFDLVKRQLNVDFRTALEWLAERYRVSLPTVSSPNRNVLFSSKTRGLELGLTIYHKQSKLEADQLKQWATVRGFEPNFLKDAEAFAALPPKIVNSPVVNDRERFDELEAAGLIIRQLRSRPGETLLLPVEIPPREFYNTPRILFTIRDDRGAINGFAGRAIGDELPKYLFSPGFPRGSTLYRLHRVRSQRPRRGSTGAKAIVHLFVVEGLADALRLETLGLQATAILGSQITSKQVELLSDLAKDLDRDNFRLAVHILLDTDDAGRRGATNAVIKLLDASVDAPGLLLDLILPADSVSGVDSNAHDPDELLRHVGDAEEALALFADWCCSPMSALFASAVGVHPASLDSTWLALTESQRLQAFRDVERRLDRNRWLEILDRIPVFECHLRSFSGKKSDWEEPLRRFLRASRGPSGTSIKPATVGAADKDDNGRLIRAVQIAEASTQRREFPIDEGSWDRLQAAIDITVAHFRELLESADNRSVLDADLMLPTLVPKGDGKYRLKALPSPETLSLQQYVLNELLRDHVDCPRFRQQIPATRFTTSSGSRATETTGAEHLLPSNRETVSFAYMLDMDVIEHRAPPRRTGMFRSYFDCWRDFIAFIDARVAAFPAGKFHVARLDVRSFYDTVSRPAVNAVLIKAVTNALSELADSSESNDALRCARLFVPRLAQPKERARALVDWLCDQSFNYQIENTGLVGQSKGLQGLPQGPDLSAYLANISLFPLDRAVSELVTKLDRKASEESGATIREGMTSSVRGAVYARYVDDMVIIARSGQDLARLRSTVEQQLALIGMELSPKTDPLPVMDEAQVREWLTDRRGAGLGVSGPFEGPPANLPLSHLEPLADAGETDRSDSLRLLHDPRLDDPDTTSDELETAVEVILSVSDSELRHGDKAGAARILWRCVIQSLVSTPHSAADAGAEFMKRWRDSNSVRREERERSVADLLAWLDGIERFLISRPDRNPTFSDTKHAILQDQRKQMAGLVHAGLCDVLTASVPQAIRPSEFDNVLELKTLVLLRAATLIQKPSTPYPISIEAGNSRAKARLLISLAEARESSELLDRAAWRADDTPLEILFHEAVARLRIANSQSTISGDPLMPLREAMGIRGQGDHQVGLVDQAERLVNVLQLWMPDLEATAEANSAEVALSAFVNLIPKHAIELIDRRKVLKGFALDGAGGTGLRLLPTPPGLEVPGLLGLRDEDRTVVRADYRPVAEQTFCPPLLWIDKIQGPENEWRRLEASLGIHQYLFPPHSTVSHPFVTRWLAEAFRGLASNESNDNQATSCPPTASNLLGPAIGQNFAESSWNVLGFCVPTQRVRGQAFLRQGDGGLVLEPVIELHDHLWRVGTALADWLGRAPSTRQLSSQRLAAPALVQEEGDDWAREAMLRFSLCRLRGKSLPVRPLRLSQETGLPMTVERVLRRLVSFPTTADESTGSAGIAHLLATLAEGRAIQTRIDSRIDPTTSGGATALLAEMARGQFRADEELAHRLPESPVELPGWAPKRRPARAMFALSERLAILAELDPLSSEDGTLNALACGTRLLCLESQLRNQALELWSLLEPDVQLKFQLFPPDLAEWNLDTTALLHRDQPPPLQGSPVPDDWRNVRELFQQLYKSTSEGSRVNWTALAGVTPLGWLAVLGTLTGAINGDWRSGLVDAERLNADDRLHLSMLATHLSRAGTDDDDLPWGGLDEAISIWNRTQFQETLMLLDRLDVATGLRVVQCQGPRLHIAAKRGRPTEVETSDGRRHLPSWSIAWARAANEIQDGVERPATPLGQQQIEFRWSETWNGNRLVGIGVVQPAMAALAGIAFSGTTPLVASSSPDVLSGSSVSSKSDTPSTEVPLTSVTPDGSHLRSDAATPRSTSDDPGKSSPQECRSIQEKEILDALGELRRMQMNSWDERSEKSRGHVRIALCQWDVDDTYRHPGFDLCDKPSARFDRKKPSKWKTHSHAASCAEFRRQAILRAALEACNRFGVDILLLPEYSTRPDTVKWIAQEVRSRAPNTSVWAGTYRLPPGMLSSRFPAWSAVQEVVLADDLENPLARAKKYPAAAADEVFCPGSPELVPLFSNDEVGDVRSYIHELICSEVFLVTSPANLLPLARVRRQLLKKFSIGGQGQDLDTMIKEDVIQDVQKFAIHTALSEGLGIRRTILLVPAMTSRSADYSVLGQAGFLASGLTTVFCNAICDHYGHGQSCFIGHDGWIDGKEVPGHPSYEPYHGVRPGIFHLDHWHRGRLGKKEQALVIADIDPIHGPEGKPRPQALLKPLQLVAHLPIIETWQPDPKSVPGACRCGRMQRVADAGEFAPVLLQALRRGAIEGWPTTMDDPAPAVLANALRLLAVNAGLRFGTEEESGRGWLMRRMEAYEAHHLADPLPWPPPVALDWIWIDPVPSEANPIPTIEVPAYANPNGDQRSNE